MGGKVKFPGVGKVLGSVPISTAWSESLGSVWPRGKSSVNSQGKTGDPGPAQGQRQPRSRWEMGPALWGRGISQGRCSQAPGCRPGAPSASSVSAALIPALLPRGPTSQAAICSQSRRRPDGLGSRIPGKTDPGLTPTSGYLCSFGMLCHLTTALTGVRSERGCQVVTAFRLGLCIQPFGQHWEGWLRSPVVQVTVVHLGVYKIAPEVGGLTRRSVTGSAVSRVEGRLSPRGQRSVRGCDPPRGHTQPVGAAVAALEFCIFEATVTHFIICIYRTNLPN